MTDGTFVVRREHKALRKMAMDPATPEGLFAAEVRQSLREHVGESMSTTQGYTVDLLSRLLVVEAYFSAFFADHPPINRKKRSAHPVVRDYLSLVNTIRNLLGDLGLERRAKQVPSLRGFRPSSPSSASAHAELSPDGADGPADPAVTVGAPSGDDAA